MLEARAGCVSCSVVLAVPTASGCLLVLRLCRRNATAAIVVSCCCTACAVLLLDPSCAPLLILATHPSCMVHPPLQPTRPHPPTPAAAPAWSWRVVRHRDSQALASLKLATAAALEELRPFSPRDLSPSAFRKLTASGSRRGASSVDGSAGGGSGSTTPRHLPA